MEKNWPGRLREELEGMAEELTASLTGYKSTGRVFTPEEFSQNSQSPIQAAIDAAAAAGGGTVRLSRGDYVSGTIDLRSNVCLEVAEGSRLLVSLDLSDYPDRIPKRRTIMDTHMDVRQSLIFAEGCSNICICGEGVIDGRGDHFQGDETQGSTPGRPFLIRVIDCRDVHITGITLKDSACWMQNYLNCDRLLIENITVDNQANFNNDGIDIDGCRKVIVRNSHVQSGDDALCFKGCAQTPTEDVLIENNTLISSCNALKIGTDTQGTFCNFLVRNCRLGGTTEDMRHIKPLGADSGISWEMVDGGLVERLLVTDSTIDHARSPIFLRIDDRGRLLPEQEKRPVGRLQYLAFEHIHGEDNGPRGSYFLGCPERDIEHVWLKDIHLKQLPAVQTPPSPEDYGELHGEYPDAHMLQIAGSGDAPAYGLWARHIKGLVLEDYHVETCPGQEVRPEYLLPDSTGQ